MSAQSYNYSLPPIAPTLISMSQTNLAPNWPPTTNTDNYYRPYNQDNAAWPPVQSTTWIPPPAPRPPLRDVTDSSTPHRNMSTYPIMQPDNHAIPTAYAPEQLQQQPAKRPYEEISNDIAPGASDEDAEGDTEDEEIVPVENNVEENCDEIRAKIRSFIQSSGMKIVEFRKQVNISVGSYNNFMKLKGPNAGRQSETYNNARAWFKKGEQTRYPGNQQASASGPPAKRAKTSTAAATQQTPKKGKGDDEKWDTSGIHLDKEEQDAVPVFDTCDDIRKKINAHMRNVGVTQASLLRHLAEQYILEPRGLRSPQFNTFLKQKGPLDGNSSGIYYAGYVYFEKLRIKQGKAKTEKREEMEKKWGPGGVDRRPSGGRFWGGPGEHPVQDEYGIVKMVKRGKRG